MKQILLTYFFLCSFIFNINAQTKNKSTFERIDNYLNELEKAGFNGSVLIELDSKPVISKGYGYSDMENKIKNSPSTLFDIGSITKQFTAAAILKAEMQGKLSVDDKISKYFNNVPVDKKNITIHDLLRHQSGLTSNVGRDYEKISEEEFIYKVLNSPLRFEPGTGFSYSNVGYSLLAIIIEKTSEQSYEAYLYENLWKPSQMEMTGYSRPKFNFNMIATGYYRNDSLWGKPTDKEWNGAEPYWHLKGNGGILSTTEDMYKWHKILMTDKILSSKAKQKYYHPKLRAEENNNSYYAYGWDVSKTTRNTTLLWHNGSNRIFYADFLRFIDEGVSMVMFTNKSHPNFNYICFEISRIIFNPNYHPEIPLPDNTENRNFTNHIIKTIELYGLEKGKEEYKNKKTTEFLLEFMMRDEGFSFIDNEKPEIAIKIFEMNVYVHPVSAKALQGLGEGYMETGKKELALKYFKESLSLNPDNPFVNDMIKKLEE